MSPLAASTDSARRKTATPAFRLDFLPALKMHPVLALGVALLSFLLLLFCAATMKPMYEAEAVIYEQPEPARPFEKALNATFDSGRYASFLEEQIQRIERPETISAALQSLPRDVWGEYGSTPQAATDGVLAKLKVGRVATSYQVALTLKGSDPKNITEIVNRVADIYLDLVRKQALTEIHEHAGLLAQQRQQVASELRKAQEEQSALGVHLGIANPDGEGDPYEGKLAALRVELVQAQSAHDAAAARLASLSGQTAGHESALTSAADEVLLSDAGLSALKSSVSERRTVLRGQMSGMTSGNPLRQRDQEELTDLDHSLDEMTTTLRNQAEHGLQEKLWADLQRTGDIESRINAQLRQQTAIATNATPNLQRAAELNSNLKRLVEREAEIDDATRNLQLEADSSDVARLIFAAHIPSAPEGSRKRLFLIASLPLALFFGLATASIARKCDPRIYTELDVENALGFPFLAILPARAEVSEAVMAEHTLRLAGGLERAYLAEGVRTLLFTPASPDTDIEPLSRMLLATFHQTGVSACRTTTADLLLPMPSESDADPKSVSPSGNTSFTPRSAGQGFARHRLALLRTHHSLVLIDAPTLVDSAETEYVARCADATIIVADCAVTTRAELISAAQLLRRIGVPTIGVVILNLKMRYAANQRHKLFYTPGPPTKRKETLPEDQPSRRKENLTMSSPPRNVDATRVQPETYRDKLESAARNVVTAQSYSPDEAKNEVALDDNCLRADLSLARSLSADSPTFTERLSKVQAVVKGPDLLSNPGSVLSDSSFSPAANDVLTLSEQSSQIKSSESKGATTRVCVPATSVCIHSSEKSQDSSGPGLCPDTVYPSGRVQALLKSDMDQAEHLVRDADHQTSGEIPWQSHPQNTSQRAAVHADDQGPSGPVCMPNIQRNLIAALRPAASGGPARSSAVSGVLAAEPGHTRLKNSQIAITSRKSNDVTEREGVLSRPWCLLSRFSAVSNPSHNSQAPAGPYQTKRAI